MGMMLGMILGMLLGIIMMLVVLLPRILTVQLMPLFNNDAGILDLSFLFFFAACFSGATAGTTLRLMHVYIFKAVI